MARERKGHSNSPSQRRTLTRRGVLKAGSAIAAAGLGAGAARGAAVSPVMAALSAYMSEARERALPDDVVEKSKHHVLDTIAAMISGGLLPGQAAIRFVEGYGGARIATVVGSGRSRVRSRRRLRTVRSAPTRPTIPMPLRCRIRAAPWCRRRSRSASSAASTARGSCARWRSATTSVRASPCASASPRSRASAQEQPQHCRRVRRGRCRRLRRRLDARQMRWLLDYTARRPPASLPGSATPTTSRRRSCSVACRRAAGVTAALLVAAGWTGIDDILSGPDNFILATAPAADPAPHRARRALRGDAHQHQEMVSRLADPGAARRARAHGEGQRVRRGGGAQGGGAARRPRSLGGRQSRDPGYLPAAHGRHHAGRRHRLFRRRA